MTKHTSKKQKNAYLFNVIECPGQSHDLNLIANLWDDVQKAISDIKPTNIHDLWTAVQGF